MKISSISVDKPFQKEFTTIFNNPVLKGEKGKFYVLEYEVERTWQIFWKCIHNRLPWIYNKYWLSYNYEISNSLWCKFRVSWKKYWDIQPVIIESNKERVIARWKKRNIFQGQSLDLSGSKIYNLKKIDFLQIIQAIIKN